MANFQGRLGIVQRVLPRYRAPFFELLAGQCTNGLGLFAGQARPVESIAPANELEVADFHPAHNIHLLSGSLYLCWQTGLINWLEEWNPDVLVVEANPRYLSTPQALRWMHRHGRPVIGWGLGAPKAASLLSSLRQARRQSFLRQFDALIAYSQRGAEEYRHAGMDPAKVVVIPNAVAPRPKGSAPKRDPIKGQATLLFVGRLQARKRLDNLLRACAGLPAHLQPRLQIVGDGPERAALERLADKIYPQAQFLGGIYDQALVDLFLTADLFVLPGTGGLAVQQAMAYGLPVIVAEGDGTQADLVSAQNGWLIPPNDERALRGALEQALLEPEALRAKGKISFQMVKDTFNLGNMGETFVNALNKVVA